MPGLNIIQSIESEIVEILSHSPLMPPTILVRPFQESLVEAGKVFSNDNVIVRFDGMGFDPLIESRDVISIDWNITFEIMLCLRDFRGHHAAYQLIETILFLLTEYVPIYANKAFVPRSAGFTDYDDNAFRYFSIKFETVVDYCERPYLDPREAVPAEVKCIDDCTQWLGLNQEEEYNICWRRYKKPGEDKYRFYNGCGQREGDEIENRWFAQGTSQNNLYGRNPDGIITGPNGPGEPSVKVNLGLWRNEPDELPARRLDGLQQLPKIETGKDIILRHSTPCCGRRLLI